MALDKLVLTFDETVDASSLKSEEFTLHNRAVLPSTVNFTFSPGGSHSDDGTVIEVSIGSSDQNIIKKLAVCSKDSDCFLVHTGSAVKDMEGISSKALPSPLAVSTYVRDNISPRIAEKGFAEFNLGTGELKLVFSETVDRASFDPTALSLQSFYEDDSHGSPRLSKTLTSAEVLNNEDTPSLTIRLSTSDVNFVKATSGLCDNRGNCYIEVTSSLIKDTSENKVVPFGDGDPFSVVTKFVGDSIRPTLQSFSMDMNKNPQEIALTFSETVKVSSVNVSKMIIRASEDQSSSSFQITPKSSVKTLTDNHIVTVQLSSNDANSIKALPLLATNESNTFLSVEDGAVQDTSTNLNKVEPSTIKVSTFTKDKTGPKLASFHLDLDKSVMFLTFNEPVLHSSFDPKLYTLQSSKVAISSTALYELTGGNVVPSASASLTIELRLSKVDTTYIKNNRSLSTSLGDSFISVNEGGVTDAVGNLLFPIAKDDAQKANQYTPDNFPGGITSFDLNLNDRTLTLQFSDVIDVSTIDLSSLTLQDGPEKNPASS
jgi:hypothetical protein